MSWREKHPGGCPLEKYKVILYGRGFWESRLCLLDRLQARRESSLQRIITDMFMAAVAGFYGYHMQHYITGLQEFEIVRGRSSVIKWWWYLDLWRWSSAARLARLSSSWRCRWRRFRQGATSGMSFKLSSIGVLSDIAVRQNMEKLHFKNCYICLI